MFKNLAIIALSVGLLLSLLVRVLAQTPEGPLFVGCVTTTPAPTRTLHSIFATATTAAAMTRTPQPAPTSTLPTPTQEVWQEVEVWRVVAPLGVNVRAWAATNAPIVTRADAGSLQRIRADVTASANGYQWRQLEGGQWVAVSGFGTTLLRREQ